MSKDLGKNWRDITGKSFGDILSIFADPDHPNLICLVGNSMRNYVFQVSDESYQWEATREWEWRREHQKTQEDFFSRYYSTTTILYQLDATLANYFAYNFGNSTTLPGFDIVPQKSVYEFEKSEAKPVQISVPFLFKPIIEHKTELWAMLLPYLTTKLIDQEKGLGLWGLKIVDPKGKQISIGPAVSDLIYKSRDREKTKQQLREKSGIQVHEVANDKPYEKVIDLGQLYGFAIPGTYKVQLVYDNSWLVDQAEGGWGGMFSGQVITVTINEDSNPMQRIWKHFKRIQNGYLESR